jgi:hypothetical protein
MESIKEGVLIMDLRNVQVDDFDQQWMRPCHLIKKYGLSRKTIWKLLSEMRTVPKYKNSFLDLSEKLHLVRDRDFLQFLQSRSKMYLRK